MASNASLLAAGASFANSSQIATAQQLDLPSSLVYADHKDFAPDSASPSGPSAAFGR